MLNAPATGQPATSSPGRDVNYNPDSHRWEQMRNVVSGAAEGLDSLDFIK